jgi:trehalose 6-phosphate synthase
MDYSKGLPERFEAVGELFDAYPELHGNVSVTQIAPPSRSKVEEYRTLRSELDQLAGRINGDYGDLDWIPLRYLARSYEREELAGLFRIAAVGLVTPLRDGMNLVAKEFVMAQDEADPGVLILSEFAGAAEQMSDALIVNPHSRGRLAETIHQALTMPLDERQQRWRALREIVMEKDINWWRAKFLKDLGGL